MIKNYIQYINENYNTMSYKDLVKKYVNSGLCIPEYQFNKLNTQDKKTYLRKRLQAADLSTSDFKDYEFEYLSNDEKNIYIKKRLNKRSYFNLTNIQFEFCSYDQKKIYLDKSSKGFDRNVTKEMLEICPEELRNFYIDQLLKEKKYINDNEFPFFNDEQKNNYLFFRLEKKHMVTDLQFSYLSDDNKSLFIDTYLNVEPKHLEDIKFTDYVFDLCTDEQKTKYIKKCIEKIIRSNFPQMLFYNDKTPLITEHQLNWCSDELKQLLVDTKIKRKLHLDKGEFKYASLELKKVYIDKLFDDDSDYIFMNDDEFKFCTEEQKKSYIDYVIRKDRYLTLNEFLMCSDKLQIYFIKNARNTFDVSNLINKVTDEVLKFFIDNKIEKRSYIDFGRLPDNFKIYYLSKVKSVDVYLTYIDFAKLSENIKFAYIKYCVRHNLDLSSDIFSICSTQMKLYYLENNNNKYFSINNFDKENDEVKKAYVDCQVRNDSHISFEYLSTELKLYYIERKNYYKKELKWYIEEWYEEYKKENNI